MMMTKGATLTFLIYSRLYHPGSSESREEKAWTLEGSKDAGVGEEIELFKCHISKHAPLAIKTTFSRALFYLQC